MPPLGVLTPRLNPSLSLVDEPSGSAVVVRAFPSGGSRRGWTVTSNVIATGARVRCSKVDRGAKPRRPLAPGCFRASSSPPGGTAGIFIAGVENARRAFCAIGGRVDHKTDLVDQACSKEGAVRAAGAFEEQAFDPQIAIQDLSASLRSRSRSPVKM